MSVYFMHMLHGVNLFKIIMVLIFCLIFLLLNFPLFPVNFSTNDAYHSLRLNFSTAILGGSS